MRWLDELAQVLGPGGLLIGSEARDAAVSPWTRLGTPLAIARPRSTAEVSRVLTAAHGAGQGVTAWGGRTGLVDGANAEGAVALSLERMNAIEEIDPVGSMMRVEAGCVLQTACEAAEAQGLMFPLDLGARGSATIGGVISTNAGGNRVVRWGMMRDQVLGLEAVLADGTVVNAMNPLIKNNAGYDIKQLFIGSEGTLGIVTRAALRLRPLPGSTNVAFAAADAFEQLPRLLRRLERSLGRSLSAFEVMWADFHTLVTTPPARGRPILSGGHTYYVLIEAMGADMESDAARFEQSLGEALEAGDIADAVIARSVSEQKAMWALRDDVGQTMRNAPIFTFDVSLRIPLMESYVEDVRRALWERWPTTASLMVFGHLGDGNLHLVIGVGEADAEARHAVELLVYGPLRQRHGSISAEHGIGLQKREFLSWSRSAEEIAVMRTLKRALDPGGILNPGKVLGDFGGQV